MTSAVSPGSSSSVATSRRGLRLTLWVLQVALGLFFMMVGYSHALAPFDQVAQQATWMQHVPRALSLFIGYAELAGGLGLIVPTATRIAPWLTPLAALGLGTIMILAIPFHIVRGEASVVWMHALLAGLALFVAWGRWRKASITRRSGRTSRLHAGGRSGGVRDLKAGGENDMLRRDFLKTATATAVGLAGCRERRTASLPVQAKETPAMSNANFADVNGQHIFYSVHGAGKPLILLHGGITPDSFGGNLAELAKGRQVIAPHLQAHGRTPDTDRPLRCETLGDDVAGLIRHLNLGKADVMGYSLGAGVALQTAIRHPDVVDRLVHLAASMRQGGSYPEAVAALKQLEANAAMLGGSVKASPLGQAYPDVDWTNLFRKVGDLTKRPFDWSADVAKVQARTLLVFADADSIRPEHMVEFWKALGGGQRDAGIDGSLRPANQFAIVPNTTHYTLAVEPMLPEIVERFLGTE